MAFADPVDWDRFKDLFAAPTPFPRRFVFRGQSNVSWSLESTFARACREAGKDFTIPNWKQHLINFRTAIRGRIQLSEREYYSDEEIWAIGQHHGLATPFLDWTESPFVAAYFAFHEGKPNQSEDRAVYALDTAFSETAYAFTANESLLDLTGQDTFLSIVKQIQTFFATGDKYEEVREKIEKIATGEFPSNTEAINFCRLALELSVTKAIKLVRPKSGENIRLINQRGLFSYHLGASTLEERIGELYDRAVQSPNSYKSGDDAVLIKIPIKNTDRSRILSNLNFMNINHSSLFPDLSGSAIHCNDLIRELPDNL